jgi:hypothetical protein
MRLHADAPHAGASAASGQQNFGLFGGFDLDYDWRLVVDYFHQVRASVRPVH